MVPKLRRKDEAKCEVALVGIKNKVFWWGKREKNFSKFSVRE